MPSRHLCLVVWQGLQLATIQRYQTLCVPYLIMQNEQKHNPTILRMVPNHILCDERMCRFHMKQRTSSAIATYSSLPPQDN